MSSKGFLAGMETGSTKCTARRGMKLVTPDYGYTFGGHSRFMLTPLVFDAIKKSRADEPVASARVGAARIRKLTQVELSETQARRIMKQLGLEYRKTAAIPGGAVPQLQLDFAAHALLSRLEEA